MPVLWATALHPQWWCAVVHRLHPPDVSQDDRSRARPASSHGAVRPPRSGRRSVLRRRRSHVRRRCSGGRGPWREVAQLGGGLAGSGARGLTCIRLGRQVCGLEALCEAFRASLVGRAADHADAACFGRRLPAVCLGPLAPPLRRPACAPRRRTAQLPPSRCGRGAARRSRAEGMVALARRLLGRRCGVWAGPRSPCATARASGGGPCLTEECLDQPMDLQAACGGGFGREAHLHTFGSALQSREAPPAAVLPCQCRNFLWLLSEAPEPRHPCRAALCAAELRCSVEVVPRKLHQALASLLAECSGRPVLSNSRLVASSRRRRVLLLYVQSRGLR
mmetsp:Transcript_106286/g.343436  ORF Transcript_106286/g.343436 Transcript_106286/m.343436 type:complete len:335 (+) Transcript_106286:59-1063(+)